MFFFFKKVDKSIVTYLIGVLRCTQEYTTFTMVATIRVEENWAAPVGKARTPRHSLLTSSFEAREETNVRFEAPILLKYVYSFSLHDSFIIFFSFLSLFGYLR